MTAFGLSKPLALGIGGGLVPSSARAFVVDNLQNIFGSGGGPDQSTDGVIQDLSPGVGSHVAQPGRCYDFDGTNDHIELPAFSSTGNAWAVIGWFKHEGGASANDYLYDQAANRIAIQSDRFGNGIVFTPGGGSTAIGNAAPTTGGDWVHFCCQSDGVTAELYQNGVLIDTGPIDGTPTAIGGGTTGRYVGTWSGSVGTNGLQGKLWDFGIVDGALTAEQVRQHYLGERPALDYLIHYTCEDQHPTLALDSSGNGNHGTKTGISAAVGQFHYEGADLPRDTSENQKGFSPRAYFNGTSSNAALGSLAGNLYSFKCKVAFNETVDYTSAASTLFSSSGTEESIGVGAGTSAAVNELLLIANRESLSRRTIWQTTTDEFEAGVEYQIEFRWDGSLPGYRIYVDGSEVPRTAGVNGHVESQLALTDVILGSSQVMSAVLGGLLYDIEIRSDADTVVFSTTGQSAEVAEWDNATLTDIEIKNIPAATASTDALGGTLTYQGKARKNGQAIQSWCGDFDGVDDWIEFEANDGYRFTNDATIAFTISGDNPSIAGNTYLLAIYDTEDDNREWGVYLDTLERLNFLAFDDGGVSGLTTHRSYFRTGVLDIDQTQRIVISIHLDGTGGGTEFRVWSDGIEQPIEVVFDNIDEIFNGVGNATIGAATSGAGVPSAGAYWNGRIYDVGWYSGTVDDAGAAELTNYRVPSGLTRLFHAPLAEGEGSPVAYDKVSGVAGEIQNADTTVGGTFWGRQDVYHHNLAEGFQWLQNRHHTSQSSSSYVLQNVTWVSGASDPFGATEAWKITPASDASSQTTRLYLTNTGSANGDYLVFWLKFDNVETHGRFYHAWTSGEVCVFDAQTESIVATTGFTVSANDFKVRRYGDWYRLSWKILDRGAGVQQFTVTRSDSTSFNYQPLNTTDGLKVFYGIVDDPDTTDPYVSDAGVDGLTDPARFPIGVFGWNAPQGPGYRPAAVFHNGAESQINWQPVNWPNPALPVNIYNFRQADDYLVVGGTANDLESLPHGEQVVRFRESAATSVHRIYSGTTQPIAVGEQYEITAYVGNIVGREWVQIYWSGSLPYGGDAPFANFNIVTSEVGDAADSVVVAEIENAENGFKRLRMVVRPATAVGASQNAGICTVLNGTTGYVAGSFAGNTEYGFDTWGWQLTESESFKPYTPAGIINTLDTAWEFPDTPANPHFQRLISDGYGNPVRVDRRLHYDRVMLGANLDKIRRYTADPEGLLFDNFNRASAVAGLDWSDGNVTGDYFQLSASVIGAYQRPLATADQEVEFTIGTGVNSAYFYGVLFRLDEEEQNGILVNIRQHTTGTYQAYDYVSGSFVSATTTINTTAPVSGDVMRVTMIGTECKIYRNGSLVATFDLSSYVDHTANRLVALRQTIGPRYLDFKARDI